MSYEQGTVRLCRCRPSCPPSFRTSLPQVPRFPGLCPSAPGQRATSSHQNSPEPGTAGTGVRNQAWREGFGFRGGCRRDTKGQTWLRALPSPVLTTPKCGDGRCTLIKISKASRQQIIRKKRGFPCGFSAQASPNTWAGAQPSVMAGHQGNLWHHSVPLTMAESPQGWGQGDVTPAMPLKLSFWRFCGFPPWWTVNTLPA
uniref:Uncharacterized protein n=1 Tax=Bubo bubo TaxID=30461 RepID=A0A8C0FD33_BUBBB